MFGLLAALTEIPVMFGFSYLIKKFESSSLLLDCGADNSMEESDKVTGQALMSGVATVGSVIGNLVGGWAIELSGVALMLEIMLIFTAAGTVPVAVSLRKKLV